jgi:hypothetical protein
MILTIGIVLLVVWLLAFTLMRKVVGGIIHLLLIITTNGIPAGAAGEVRASSFPSRGGTSS